METAIQELSRGEPGGKPDQAAGALEAVALATQSLNETVTAAQETASKIIERLRERLVQEPLPVATYRIQFHKGFTFRDAAKRIAYLKALGVSHIYASPFLKATSGSTHGYDIVDHSQLNPELGGQDGFDHYVAVLKQHGLQQILDLVPNHMGVGTDENPWWQDVLENGQSSPYSTCFDIEWHPLKQDLLNKVLLPVLGDQFGKILEDGQLVLRFEDGIFWLDYHGRKFPLAPRSYGDLLGHRIAELESLLGAEQPAFLEYQSILTAIGHLPPRDETNPERLVERQREKEVIKRRIARLCEEEPRIKAFIVENLNAFNGRRGEPQSFDLLDNLLQGQAYRLSFWRVASDEINYRRFFDVNELAAICMERPEVFDRAHPLVLQLLESDQIHGLRIDHADGLFDPTTYLWQLQEKRFLQRCRSLLGEVLGERSEDADGMAPTWEQIEIPLREFFGSLRADRRMDPLIHSLYLVVEKILEGNEKLPDDWPVHGTTGYEFLNHLNDLYVDSSHAKEFDSLYSRFIGRMVDFHNLVSESKRLIMRVSMSSELNSLGHQLDRISERRRASRDFTLNGLTYALREVVSLFPIYRTYTTAAGVLDRDRRYVEQSVARAKRKNPAMNMAVFDFIRDVLLLADQESLSEEERRERLVFIGRFQQFTGPMMAKAVEDTAFYNYNRLVSINEVGGDPAHFGDSVATFHRLNQERQASRPHALLATATHDTKRSEDVRARINLLSEIPKEWKERLTRWTRWNKRKKTKVDGELAPGRNDEYLLYQTLAGSWPFESPRGEALHQYTHRIQQYMKKAASEAKANTSWIAPNEAYENALQDFVAAILSDEPESAFRTDFEPFATRIARWGIWNSISQVTVKLTSPGIPDIYQGTELWDFSLVDPDNRRPVDYDLRERWLKELDERGSNRDHGQALADELLRNANDGRIKLLVTSRMLRLRCEFPDLFTRGAYVPLDVRGAQEKHICAFARTWQDHVAVVIAPRMIATLLGESTSPPIGPATWSDTSVRLPAEIARGSFSDLFTGREIGGSGAGEFSVGDVLQSFPVSVLTFIPAKT